MSLLRGVIFDLDGVLVRTDRFHFESWKKLADELGLPFDEQVNHRLRGIPREDSLRTIYRHAGAALPDALALTAQCTAKNRTYVELIARMTPADVLPGGRDLLADLRRHGVKTGIASASRNCRTVLERTRLAELIDVVIDGNCVTRPKPDPQSFTLALEQMGIAAAEAVGVEDAATGVESIHRAGMKAVGIGEDARAAEVWVPAVCAVTRGVLEELVSGQ